LVQIAIAQLSIKIKSLEKKEKKCTLSTEDGENGQRVNSVCCQISSSLEHCSLQEC